MGWYRRAQQISAGDMEADMSNRDLRYTMTADAGDEFINVITIPVRAGLAPYLTIQLDATHRGKLPKSEELKSILYESLKAIDGYGKVDFFDDHYDPIEALIPSGGSVSHNSSVIVRIIKPVPAWRMKDILKAFVEKWKEMGGKLAGLGLIDYWEVKDSKYNVVGSGESKALGDKVEKMFQEDSENFMAFMCKADAYAKSHPEEAESIDRLKKYMNWPWENRWVKRKPEADASKDLCSKKIDKKWSMIWSDELPFGPREDVDYYRELFENIAHFMG